MGEMARVVKLACHTLSTDAKLVLPLQARISASLINWCSGKLFIKWYRARLTTGPLF